MRTKSEVKRYREMRRRRDAADYAREARAARREAGVPDARAVGAALLSLALDEAAERGGGFATVRMLDRLVETGYDRDAAKASIRALVERHAEALAIKREAEAQAACQC